MTHPKIVPAAGGAVEPLGRVVIAPRLLRLRDAPKYLGMDKNRFNREVRPFVTVIRIGIQGIAFDRRDLDAWVDEYKRRAGRSAVNLESGRASEVRNPPGSPRAVSPRASTRTASKLAFRRAVERAISRKP